MTTVAPVDEFASHELVRPTGQSYPVGGLFAMKGDDDETDDVDDD